MKHQFTTDEPLVRFELHFSSKFDLDGVFAPYAQLWQAYYNLCLRHSALRLQLPEPVPTRGNGSPKKWQHCTPAMAAGITNQVWTVQQLLLFRIPPWRQEVAL